MFILYIKPWTILNVLLNTFLKTSKCARYKFSMTTIRILPKKKLENMFSIFI